MNDYANVLLQKFSRPSAQIRRGRENFQLPQVRRCCNCKSAGQRVTIYTLLVLLAKTECRLFTVQRSAELHNEHILIPRVINK
jgi:hypothetical protein